MKIILRSPNLAAVFGINQLNFDLKPILKFGDAAGENFSTLSR